MERSALAFVVLYSMYTCYCFPSQPAHTFILYLFFSFLPPFCFVFFLYFLLHSTSLCIFPSSLSCRPFYLSILAPQERNAVIFLLLPKPQLESIGLIKVKGKGLKRKVFHASCEWYAGALKVPSVFSSPFLFYYLVCVCAIL